MVGPAGAEHVRDLGDGVGLRGVELPGEVALLGAERGWSASGADAGPGGGRAAAGALDEDVALELGDRGEDVEDQPSSRRRRWCAAGRCGTVVRCVRKRRLSRSAARRVSLAGMVVRTLRPRTSPRIRSCASAGPTVCWRRPGSRCGPARRSSCGVHRAPPGAADLPGAVTQPAQRVDDPRVVDRARRGRTDLPSPIGARGDRQALLAQCPADRLAPRPGGALLVDEADDQRWRGSSSLAKKIEADFKISLVSRSSAFSFFSRLISARSSLVRPLRCPAAVCACNTHLRGVSGPTPSFGPNA